MEIDSVVRDLQRRISIDPFDQQAVLSLYILNQRFKSRVMDSRRRSEIFFNKEILNLILPLMTPIKIIDDAFQRQYSFILMAGENFSYDYPFLECYLTLYKGQRKPMHSVDPLPGHISGSFMSIDDTHYFFNVDSRPSKSEELYADILAFINTLYTRENPDKIATLPQWDYFKDILKEKFHIYDTEP